MCKSLKFYLKRSKIYCSRFSVTASAQRSSSIEVSAVFQIRFFLCFLLSIFVKAKMLFVKKTFRKRLKHRKNCFLGEFQWTVSLTIRFFQKHGNATNSTMNSKLLMDSATQTNTRPRVALGGEEKVIWRLRSRASEVAASRTPPEGSQSPSFHTYSQQKGQKVVMRVPVVVHSPGLVSPRKVVDSTPFRVPQNTKKANMAHNPSNRSPRDSKDVSTSRSAGSDDATTNDVTANTALAKVVAIAKAAPTRPHKTNLAGGDVKQGPRNSIEEDLHLMAAGWGHRVDRGRACQRVYAINWISLLWRRRSGPLSLVSARHRLYRPDTTQAAARTLRSDCVAQSSKTLSRRARTNYGPVEIAKLTCSGRHDARLRSRTSSNRRSRSIFLRFNQSDHCAPRTTRVAALFSKSVRLSFAPCRQLASWVLCLKGTFRNIGLGSVSKCNELGIWCKCIVTIMHFLLRKVIFMRFGEILASVSSNSGVRCWGYTFENFQSASSAICSFLLSFCILFADIAKNILLEIFTTNSHKKRYKTYKNTFSIRNLEAANLPVRQSLRNGRFFSRAPINPRHVSILVRWLLLLRFIS